MLEQLSNAPSMKFIAQLEAIFKDLPHLPKKATEVLVKLAPYFAIIGGILTVIAGLSMLVSGSSLAMLGGWYAPYGANHSLYFYLDAILSLAVGALMIMAYKPLQSRKLMGWIYIFWSEMVSVLQSLLAVIFFGTGIIGALLGIALGLYILFEMKPSYEKKAAKAK